MGSCAAIAPRFSHRTRSGQIDCSARHAALRLMPCWTSLAPYKRLHTDVKFDDNCREGTRMHRSTVDLPKQKASKKKLSGRHFAGAPAKPAKALGTVKRESAGVATRTSAVVGEKLAARVSEKAVAFGLKTSPRFAGRANYVFGEKLDPLHAHDLAIAGMPVAAAVALLADYQRVQREHLLATFGISERTLQRASAAGKALDSNASDRALRLHAITLLAKDVLGTHEAAERWLLAPAMGLSRRCPIDLLQSTEGTELVKTLLQRMDYGVYA